MLSLALLTGISRAEEPSARPNILWVTCEDISPHLGCYGDSAARTPHLDALATEAVRYTNAFAAAPVCSPTRSCLITGVFPTSLGTQHLRTRVEKPDTIRCFTEFLREAGYYCSNNVKEDYQFRTPNTAWDESSKTAHWRGRKADQPFFSVFNFIVTHQSRVRFTEEEFQAEANLTPEQRHDPADVPVPPYYPDTPIVRRDVARLYDMITAMDTMVGDLLAQLEEDGLTDNTIVFFYSDHGDGMPRGKRWLYDTGIQVPLMVRFPQKYSGDAPKTPGSTTDRLVSFVDFAPTVLSLVGLDVPDYMQGSAFLGNAAAEPRSSIFAVRDRVDEVLEMSRAVRDKRFKYIRNFMPHLPHMQYGDYSEKTPTRQELRRLAASGELVGQANQLMSPTKPAEELYDVVNDPYEANNLAELPQHADTLVAMREQMAQRMLATRDTGLFPESQTHSRCAEGMTIHAMAGAFDRFDELMQAADGVGREGHTAASIRSGLKDPDSAIRYWTLITLLNDRELANRSQRPLAKALTDPAPDVRIAAAEVLCMLKQHESGLPVLATSLEDEDGWVRLHAAAVLDRVGSAAAPVEDAIRQATKLKTKHPANLYMQWCLGRVIARFNP